MRPTDREKLRQAADLMRQAAALMKEVGEPCPHQAFAHGGVIYCSLCGAELPPEGTILAPVHLALVEKGPDPACVVSPVPDVSKAGAVCPSCHGNGYYVDDLGEGVCQACGGKGDVDPATLPQAALDPGECAHVHTRVVNNVLGDDPVRVWCDDCQRDQGPATDKDLEMVGHTTAPQVCINCDGRGRLGGNAQTCHTCNGTGCTYA